MGDYVENQSWAGFKAGHAEIWRAVLDETIPKLYAMFMQSWRNPSLAEELVQRTTFDAVRGRDKYDAEKGSPQQWLFGIARNNIRIEIRRRQSRGSFDGDITTYLEAIDSEMLPDEILERQETAQLVRDALAKLPGKEQAVLKGKYIEGLSARQIAENIDSTEKAVHSLLYRARMNLREEIERLAPLIKEGQKR
ncbi:MAG: sigma-70 family RNA polymerase sigma factor [Phycisphaerales bacterium]